MKYALLIASALMIPAPASAGHASGSRQVRCADPYVEWVGASLSGRYVPMGKGHYMAHYDWRGGYSVYYCEDREEADFRRLPESERQSIIARFAAGDKARLAEDRAFAEKYAEAVRRQRESDRALLAKMKRGE